MFVENVLVPVFLGICSFLTLHGIINPVLEFFRLRKEIHEDLIDMANIWSVENTHDEQRARIAIDRIRRLSAQMTALDHSLNYFKIHIIARFIVCGALKMDIESAAKNLMIYHNDFMDRDGLRTKARHEIEKSLNLPLTDTSKRVELVLRMAETRNSKTG
jgi:hypothetical protein